MAVTNIILENEGENMTTQEIIEIFENKKKMALDRICESAARKEVEAITLAISAINRITPKKPGHNATIRNACTCPRCSNVVDEFTEFRGQRLRVTSPYCKFCGQALDWGDGDEEQEG